MTNQIDTRLSYSSASLLMGCEQRYVHYKVNKVDKDKDFNDNMDHFAIGKAFHWILEVSDHKKPDNIGNLLKECIEGEIGMPEQYAGLVHAMVIKYLRLHKTTGLELVKAEIMISNEYVLGFVDAIFKEEDGSWWISDLKTAATLSSTLISRLPKDRQLNLYASFAPDIAAELGLDLDKFKGCRYKVTTKSKAKMQAKENYNEYVMRMADKLIRSYDIIVPIEVMQPMEAYEDHVSLHNRSIELRQGKTARKNLNYCESYFKPCPYWSQCHGDCFSDMSEALEVLT